MSPRRVLDQAREVLAAGDGRKTLDLIRQVRDRNDILTGLPPVSFCASMQRARRLPSRAAAVAGDPWRPTNDVRST